MVPDDAQGPTADERLRLSEERHRLLAEHAHDVVWTMSPAGEITYVSPSVQALRGITPQEAMRQSIDEIHPPASQAVSRGYFQRLAEDLAAGRPPREFHCELEYYRKDGSTVWTDVQVIPWLDQDGNLQEILGVSRDISEHKRHEDELRRARAETEAANAALVLANAELGRLAATDPLTGAWNRRHGEEVLAAQRDVGGAGEPLSLLLFDIDTFKDVNDLHGHPAGDRVLAALTERVQRRLRGTDILARWGGDEFLVLLPQCGLADATRIAEQLREAVAATPFPEVGAVTISVGATETAPGEVLEDWVERADAALYAAKADGRNLVRAA